MDYRLPGLVLTGASGFEGRYFIEAAGKHFRLFCVARRSAAEVGVQEKNTLRWFQADIADRARLQEMIPLTKDFGGVDYIVHFAGYYDYTNKEHPSYARTNVEGTRNILELARHLEIKRFIFLITTEVQLVVFFIGGTLFVLPVMSYCSKHSPQEQANG